jgi:curved DNA-binding protein CbpA
MKDYYTILGLSRYAAAEEIKQAYRALAKRYHPDLNPGNAVAEERFKEISLAYDTLSDPLEKKKYDFKILYGFIPPKAADNKEDLKKQAARKQAFAKYAEKKKQHEKMYRRRTIYAGICVLIVIFIGLSLPGEVSQKEERMHDFLDKNHDEFLIARAATVYTHEIMTADSPYDSIFGEGRYDDRSEAALLITNHLKQDVVATLVQVDGSRQTIRNEFIHSGDTYNMAHLPEGNYKLRIFEGLKWDPEGFVFGQIKGVFTQDTLFAELSLPVLKLVRHPGKVKSMARSASIVLNDNILIRARPLSASSFFNE